MPEHLYPGVYVEETAFGPKPIEGVPTSVAAFIGATGRGPLVPTLVTSAAEYRRRFGAPSGADGYMPDAADAFFLNGGQRLYVARVVGSGAAPAEAACGATFTVRAATPGTWGARVFVRIDDHTAQGGPAAGFRLRAACYDDEPAGDPLGWFDAAAGAPTPAVAEDFDRLVTDASSPDHWQRRLEGSALVKLIASASAPADAAPAPGTVRLSGGSDGAVPLTVADFEGAPSASRPEPQGLAALALDACREVALVYAPGASVEVARAVIRHCESQRFRFAIVDSLVGEVPATFDARTRIAESKSAAFYYPWVRVAAGGRQTKLVPPGGAVAGTYARTDIERGVHKSPANEVVRGAVGLAVDVDNATGGALNERHINVLRQFPARGIRIWGARTLSADPEWKYVAVRRYFLFVERSIDEGTDWVVFEPNDERLWTKVRHTIGQFLRRSWQTGALEGRTQDEAFFVKCDRSTMTADDVLNGRLVCEVGLAPIRPAEFIVLRFCWHTAAA